MEEIIYRIKMNCPYLTTLDLSNMDGIWTDAVLEALKTNTNLKRLKVKDDERRMEWVRASKVVSFVDRFVAMEGPECMYHIFSPLNIE